MDRLESMLERAERKNVDGRYDWRVAELKAQLATPPFPFELFYIWRIFRRMRRRKAGGFAGPEPLEYRDFVDFQTAARFRLDPWEVELIEQLDDLFLGSSYAAIQAEREAVASFDDPAAVKAVLDTPHGRRVIQKKGGDDDGD